jgi:putative phosphoribosyl transferase
VAVQTLGQIDCLVRLPDDAVTLSGDLYLPRSAEGLVVLCGNFSGLADAVACLQGGGIATLSVDLLTANEQLDCRHATCLRANLPLLAHRLACATDWLRTCEHTRGLPIGYFGSDIGSAVALAAAAQRPADVEALVSYAGRPVLALPVLAQVRTPTLLITAAADPAMVKLHHIALAQLHCQHAVAILTGPEEVLNQPLAVREVARLACDWFARYLRRPAGALSG